MSDLPEDEYEPYWKALGILICMASAAVAVFGICKLLGGVL